GGAAARLRRRAGRTGLAGHRRARTGGRAQLPPARRRRLPVGAELDDHLGRRRVHRAGGSTGVAPGDPAGGRAVRRGSPLNRRSSPTGGYASTRRSRRPRNWVSVIPPASRKPSMLPYLSFKWSKTWIMLAAGVGCSRATISRRSGSVIVSRWAAASSASRDSVIA